MGRVRGRVPSGGRAPFCDDCGAATCHPVLQGGGYVWLCGSCETLRNDPKAKRRSHPPGLPSKWPRRGKPQKDTLF